MSSKLDGRAEHCWCCLPLLLVASSTWAYPSIPRATSAKRLEVAEVRSDPGGGHMVSVGVT